MNVLFRVDASIWIGSGHVMRCLVLADEMKRQGFAVCFACLPQKGDMCSYIEQRGYEVINLTPPEYWQTPTSSSDYSAWLQRTVQEDAFEFTKHLDNVSWVVCDHYALGAEWQKMVKKKSNARILAIDDLVRQHFADLLVDQTLNRKKNDYCTLPNVLTGSKYALLKPDFYRLRKKAYQRVAPSIIPKVLVSMGGVDAQNITLKVIEKLLNESNALLTVLLSPRSPHYFSVLEYCSANPNVTHMDFTENMAELMLEHDIAIGAPGTTSWERACLGLPNIIIPIAENQVDNCSALVDAKATIKVDVDKIHSHLIAAYDVLIGNFTMYVNKNLEICDGLGAPRVVDIIKEITLSDIELRFATVGDIDITYKWQTQPLVRKYFKNPELPTYLEHKTWTEKVIEREYIDLYIICKKRNAVGTVRIDKDLTKNTGEISILIAREFHGNSYAKLTLNKIKVLYEGYTIKAFVHKDNVASQSLFEKAGFNRIDANNFEWSLA